MNMNPKWTPSTLIKWTDRTWSKYLESILLDDRFTREQKNKAINDMLPYYKNVYENCFSGDDRDQWKFKKK